MLTARLGLTAVLDARAAAKGPITIGLAGAGQMGTDLVVQIAQMPGVRLGAVAEVFPENALAAIAMTGRARGAVALADGGAGVDAAIEGGKIAVVEDSGALCDAGLIDAIIDATGNPNVGARLALGAIAAGKHIVMLNVEADITMGATSGRRRRRRGWPIPARRATNPPARWS